MKKLLAVLLIAAVFLSVLSGCGGGAAVPESAAPSAAAESSEAPEAEAPAAEESPAPAVIDDGRARPSCCGRLRVVDGKLCSESGEPVMLRGVSTNSLITAEDLLNEPLFEELSRDDGVNVVRLAMYTYGVGSLGYCTNGDKDRHKADIVKGVELARSNDMYVLVDWHILSDGLYEICNEPNGVDWPTVKRYAEQIIPVIRGKDPASVIIVGNPDWSKDLYSVAADPLDFENVLYTLHFYAATHGQEFRDMTEELSREGLPIFVSEYGVTSSSGGHPRDLESADLWIELLERENISYCLWSFSKAPEPCSVVRSTVLKYSGFTTEDYTKTGLWLMETLEKYRTR